MEAGVADHVWNLEEVIALLDWMCATTASPIYLAVVCALLTGGFVIADSSDSTIHEPPYIWDWVHIPKVEFERCPIRDCLEDVNEMCNRELSKNGGTAKVVFEYHFSVSKVGRLVTLKEKDVAVLELLRQICFPNGIAVEERSGKILFRDLPSSNK